MGYTIDDICGHIEKEVPGTCCFSSPDQTQIAVTFNNRTDTVIHLLTPFYQNRLSSGKITEEDILQLVSDVRSIAERKPWTDAIIEDLEVTLRHLY